MTKRKYLQPMMNVVRIQSQHMLAYSEIQTSGLDEGETIDYGNNTIKSGNLWDSAW
jgi:hypothetical protein